MLLKKIKIENIRSYNNQEIEFTSGSTLLSGDIGTGKTSILLAIEFALFGLQPGQRGTSLLRNDKNSGSVELVFEVDDQEIAIERKLKRAKSVTQDYVAITTENGKKEMSVTEAKNLVLSLLNYPLEFAKKTNLLYKFTVYTPQEEMKQIILEDSQTRLNTLRHVFGIDKYKKIKENLDIFNIKLREDIREKEGQLQDLDLKKTVFEEKKKNLETLRLVSLDAEKKLKEVIETRKKFELEIEEIEKNLELKKNYEKEIEKSNVMLLGKREMILQINREKEQLQKQIEEASKLKFNEQDFEKIKQEILDLKGKNENLNKELIELTSRIHTLESKNQENLSVKEKLYKIEICPTCLQDVKAEYKSNIFIRIEQELNRNNQELRQLIDKKQNILAEIDDMKNKIEQIEKEKTKIEILKIKQEGIKEKNLKLDELNSRAGNLEKDIEILNEQISVLKDSIRNLLKYEQIYYKKEKEIDEALKLEKDTEIKYAEIKKEHELLSLQISEIEKEIEKKETLKLKMRFMLELHDWLSNKFLQLVLFTEKIVMLRLREEFEKLFNKWFCMLVTENFLARLDEDFTPIISQQDYELDYSYLSGGERTAVALAYRMALNQVINSLLSRIKTRDLVILDEPTDGFSSQQLDKMRDVLNELQVNQLILVSHEPKIEDFVDRIVKFRKEDGVSIVE